MTKQTKTISEQAVDQWLYSQGFHFNPFGQLDAATDPYLDHYLVQHEAFNAVWGDWHTVIFEPAGGGKTALRVGTVHTCHIGQETNRPFPISYLPPFLHWGHVQPTLNEHLSAIMRYSAAQLLFSLAHRPHWFLRLGRPERRAVRTVLDRGLPGPLKSYLVLLAETNQLGQLSMLWRRLQLSPYLPLVPDQEQLLEFRLAMEATASEQQRQSVEAEWRYVQQVVTEVLGFPSIFLLLDGLDTTAETVADPQALARVCRPLWENLEQWQTEQLFVKAFLPIEAQSAIEQAQRRLLTPIRVAGIEWHAELLVELLAQRINFATQGELASLAVLATPDLAALEEQMVAAVQPLPRDLLFFTNELLRCHVEGSERSGRITQHTFGQALATYQAHTRQLH